MWNSIAIHDHWGVTCESSCETPCEVYVKICVNLHEILLPFNEVLHVKACVKPHVKCM